MAVADGILLTPSYSISAGMASALSMRHVGFRYGGFTDLSFSFDDPNGFAYVTEDTGHYTEGIYLTFGMANSNVRAKFGSTSLLHPDTSYTALPAGTYPTAQTYADFSLEFWVFFEDATDIPIVTFEGGGYVGRTGGTIRVSAGTNNNGGTNVSLNTWHHFAFTRKANIVRAFLNGHQELSYVFAGELKINGFPAAAGGSRYYLDSLGFSGSYCHYWQDFSPPVLPFNAIPSSSGVVITQPYSLVPAEASGSLLTPSEYDGQWSRTAILLSPGGVDGTPVKVDAKNRQFYNNGNNVTYSSNKSKFGSSSLYFPGSASHISVWSSSDLDIMDCDFTLEVWVNPSTLKDAVILSKFGDLRPGWGLTFDGAGKIRFAFYSIENGTMSTIYGANIAANQWSFIAVSRTGDDYRIWVNGALGDTLNLPYGPFRVTTRMYPGGGYGGDSRDWDVPLVLGSDTEIGNGNYHFHGYMEDFRFTVGYSRYRTAETMAVPTKSFVPTGSGVDGDPYWSDVKCLLHFDEPHGTVANIRDARGNSIVTTGGAYVGTDHNGVKGRCGNFLVRPASPDNSTIKFPLTNDFDLSSGDFTIEFWCDSIQNSGVSFMSAHQSDPNRGWYINWLGYDTQPLPPYYGGYFQWNQWDANGVNDVAISDFGVICGRRWFHFCIQRRGDDITFYVDGVAGPTTTITRRPAYTTQPIQLGGTRWCSMFHYDEFRLTRAARYGTNFKPVAGKYPEYPFSFGQAVISETASFIPGQVAAAAQVDGATFGYESRIVIPDVVAPTLVVGFSLPTAAAATGGEGVGETLGLSDTLNFRHAFRYASSLSVADTALVQYVAGAESGMGVSDAASVTLGNVTAAEGLLLTEQWGKRGRLGRIETEGIKLSAAHRVGIGIPLADAAGFNELTVVTKCASLWDRMFLYELIGTQFTFQVHHQEGVAFAVGVGKHSYGGEAVDSLGLHAESSRAKAVIPIVSEGVGFSAGTGGAAHITITVPESWVIADGMEPAQMLEALIAENVEFVDYMASPSFTTWVMNTRTNAVSEYAGYRFNSFTQVGERVLGANDAGLFWLDGGDDAGTPIEAVIQPGVVQPHGNKLANVHYAYLGMRGDSDFVFTITDEAGGSFAYRLDANSMKTGKVPFGRGLKTRYFTFNMRSMGGDFDLDNIEFITQETARKVQR